MPAWFMPRVMQLISYASPPEMGLTIARHIDPP